tara:strand:+ start:10164 stop:10445 length:282 start_codon:yes stop_codon:yes gene_type:complete
MADKTQREAYLELALRTIQTELLESWDSLTPFTWKITTQRGFDERERDDFGTALRRIHESLSIISGTASEAGLSGFALVRRRFPNPGSSGKEG